MMKVLGLLLILSVGARAEISLKKEKSLSTKESMAIFLDELIGLKKFLGSDDEFIDSKNTEKISMHLRGLAKAIKNTAHDPLLRQENFKFSREVLEDHVTETERVFRLGNKSFARWMTNSTLGICMGCHTQLPTQSRKFALFFKSGFFTSAFDEAEFMYATKNFEGADKIYRDLILGFPKNNLSPDRLDRSVQRVLTYRIRVARDLPSVKSTIVEFRKNKQLPEFILRNLDAWSEQTTLWQEKKLPDPMTAKSREIITFAEKNLSFDTNQSRIETADPRFISNLIVSGILYEYLHQHSHSTDVPDILYRLATIDREMNNSPFYSLADLYLKECMLKFPESKIAKKCYSEYEAEMIIGYSGSAGVNIPREVLEDLKYLKNFVDTKGKSPLKKAVP